MLKNNGGGLDNNKNGFSPYVSWFVRDTQELKRGGTAPINQGRKNRANPSSEANKPDQNDLGIDNLDNVKNIPVVTASKASNSTRVGTAMNNENHKITRVFNNSGINTYKLTKKPTPEEENNRMPTGIAHAFGFGQGLEYEENQGLKFDKRSFNIPLQGEGQSEVPNVGHGSTNESNFENFQSNRPQTAHIKGSGAFRRGRILNESSHNYEEFQTPNTGNLELESLHSLNNKPSERNSIQNGQKEQRLKTGEFKNAQEFRNVVTSQHTRQTTQTENEYINPAIPKFSNGIKIAEKGPIKAEDMKFGVFGKEDNERERINSIKFSRIKTADGKANKAKPLVGGRRYAEDMYTYNVDDPEDQFANEGITRNTYKGNDIGEERHTETGKDNLVAMIGRSCQDTVPKRNLEEDNDFNVSPQKSLANQPDPFDIIVQKSPTQRPPARKNGQAMFLNNYAGLQEADKKAAMMSPTKNQQNAIIRPPSRQKAPTKALGLDVSDEAKKNEIENGQNGQGMEKETGYRARGDAGGRKTNFVKDNEFGLDDDDFENLDFDRVLDIADFLDVEEGQRNQNQHRPTTSIASQRAVQTSQSFRPQASGNKHAFLQSAKGRPSDGQQSHLNSLLNNNKPEQSDKFKVLKTQKDSSRLDSAYKGQKAKGQSKLKNDLEVCDIVDDNSDSNHSQDAIPKRVATAQPTSIISKGQSTTKFVDSEKPNSNVFVNAKPLAFKDKKSQIVFIYNKESHAKKDAIDLPFETTLEKDFVGLFAN